MTPITSHDVFRNANFAALAQRLGAGLVAALFAASAFPAATDLANEPFALSTKINAAPNIMFVLDDSGSMAGDYLPDWAGPYQQMISSVLTTVTPAYRFFNNAYNGVAYDPGVRYRPPVMYASDGSLDITTYPSMTGVSTTTGGDGSATSLLPNWRNVKIDGYGVQSTAFANLEGNAFYYVTQPGEYCSTKNLRSCTASATPTGSYVNPAPLRWCTTYAQSIDTTGNAGTNCQAINIEDDVKLAAPTLTDGVTSTGVTTYMFPRMPRPRQSTLTVTGVANVTGITVSSQQILSATATGATTDAIASDIVAKINACTFGLPAVTNCAVVGYSATVTGSVVTISAPGATTVTPVVTGGSTTVTAFSGGNVPGASLLTVVTPSITSYPYPGTATKGVNRTDCAGTVCTYAEEMTNYANWYAYYHTRMQMMKTSTSIAFSNVDNKYRVGYFSINNGTGSSKYLSLFGSNSSDYLNISAFDGTQKYNWYRKLLAAFPYGATPLRIGLANAGRIYAGKLSTLNGQSVTDPVQYSCQQNYTLLSTDGYWNDDAATLTQLGSSAPIGNQDGNDPRPYYDGSKQVRTVSQTTRTDTQMGQNTFLIESQTQQLKATTSRIDQTIAPTKHFPYEQQVTQLQSRSTPLNQTRTKLELKEYALKSDTKALEERTYYIQSATRPLESYTYNLTNTPYTLNKIETKVTVTTSPLQKTEQFIEQRNFKLQSKEMKIRSRTTPVQKKVQKITVTTYPLQQYETRIVKTTYQLQSNTYKLKKSVSQLQRRMDQSPDGGDTWFDTGWVDVSSCNTTPTAGLTRNIQCKYNTPVDYPGQSNCSTVLASTSSPYTVAQAVACTYETSPTTADTGSCTASSASGSSPYSAYVTCTYNSTPLTTENQQSTCTAFSQSTASKSGNKVTCVYESSPYQTTTGSPCTRTTSDTGAAAKFSCGYSATANTPTTGQSTCTAIDQSGTNPTTWTGDKTTCTLETTANFADVPSGGCSTQNFGSGPNYQEKISCQWGTTGSWTGYTLGSCSPNTTMSVGAKVECEYQADTAVSWADSATCNYRNPSDFSQSRIWCGYASGYTSTPNKSSCSEFSQSTTNSSITMSGDKVTCQYQTSALPAPVPTCTSRSPADFSNTQITCGYGAATAPVTGQSSCTAKDQTGAALGSTWTGDKVECAWDATSTTSANQSSCQWSVPASPSATRTQCSYTAGTATNNLTTCNANPRSTGTANGTTWNGPANECTYMAAVTATNLTTCTPSGSASSGPAYSSYVTCGYGTAVNTPNLSSCTVDPPEAGPSYSGGSTTACSYQTGYSAATKTSCTKVAQSGTFAAPAVDCVYLNAVTATDIGSCTEKAESTANPYAGPATHCYYAGTTISQNLDAATCTTNEQTGTADGTVYSGRKRTCAYAGSSQTTAVASCTTNNALTGVQPSGTTYPGAAVSCAYGTTGSWVNVPNGGSCTIQNQSGSSPYSGPQVECAYNGPSVNSLADNTCTDVAGSSGSANGTVYNVVFKKVCVPGDYPQAQTTTTTIVDNCVYPNPTTTGVQPDGTRIDSVTSCTYRAPVTTDVGSCTEVPPSGASPLVTAVHCTQPIGAWTPVEPSCTKVGTVNASSPGFNASGTAVDCRVTDSVGTTVPTGSATLSSATLTKTPAPVASCTDNTNTSTKVQTVCTQLLNTGTNPVQTCTSADPPTGPSFVRTVCATTNTSSTVMGCVPQVASSPLWQTVTCVDDGSGTSNTLADVAAYFYKTDLRTDALGNCNGAIVPPATTASVLCSATDAMNNVTTTTADPANWQHMTTFTLGLGASGYMKYSDTYATDSVGDFPTVKGVSPYLPANGINADPANGVCSWQATGLCNWTIPVSDEQTTIDDLWHAGVNGHGAYFSATNPDTLSNALTTTLTAVAAAGGASASPTISNPTLTPGDNYIFSSTYTSIDWTGELVRRQLNPVTGAISASNDWSVQAKLDANSSRTIYTYDASVVGTKLKAFTAANYGTNAYFNTPHIATTPNGLTQFLCASADTCLSATDQDSSHAAGANLVNFLRGVRTNEGALTNNTKYYRQRAHVMGDMVNAQVVFVTSPMYNYGDAGYSTFKSNNASRQKVVYAGANDGMLHAFYATGTAATEALITAAADAYAAAQADPTNASLASAANTAATAANTAVASDSQIGTELWAYIPSMVMPNLYHLADKKYKDSHRYYVDATPVVGDICTSNCSSSGSATWKTILVGGLGKGGRGYYALDITDPASPKALWEFTDTNLGYSYGNPQIAKLSDGSWVVMVTSGYNNVANSDGAGGDGVGRLYILDANTGVQKSFSPISTGAGSTGTPSGLAKITAQVVNPNSDNTVEAVYGGDLLGNLWRFDVNNNIGAAGYDAHQLAILKDGSGNTQPISVKPEVSQIQGYKVVFVGTGRFLHTNDASDTSQQSIYAIRDDRSTTTFDNPGGGPRTTGTSSLGFVRQIQSEITCPVGTLANICASGSTVITSTKNPVDFIVNKGWFVDLIHSGERDNTDPALALGLLAINTNAPSIAACDVGGKSYTYYFDYLDGGPIYSPGNGSPALNNGVVGKLLANELGSAPSLVVTQGGYLLDISGLSGGGINVSQPPLPPPASITRRTSWRELIQE